MKGGIKLYEEAEDEEKGQEFESENEEEVQVGA